MKKIVVLLVLLVFPVLTVVGSEKPFTFGVHSGWTQHFGLVLGYGDVNTNELNIVVGGLYAGSNGFAFGGSVNYLFHVHDFNTPKPNRLGLSIGPEFDGSVALGSNKYLNLGVYGVVKLQYSFDFPLNLYIQGGPGIKFKYDDSELHLKFNGTFGVGIRYIFR